MRLAATGDRGSCPSGLDQTLLPRSGAFWPLPGPSLCYVPELHGLPEPEATTYQEPNHPVYGGFNHTRKLTRSTRQRLNCARG